MESKEEVIIEGKLQQVKKQRYCFHLVLIDEHQRETRWIYEPHLWKSGPQSKTISGQKVICQGYKEIPAVSMRGFPPPEPRYRATMPISLQEQRSLSDKNEASNNNENWRHASSAFEANSSHIEVFIKSVLEMLRNPPSTFRWIKSGYWYCFDYKMLQRCFNDISQQQLQDCISTLMYRGDIALVDATEGLFTPVTHDGFIAPALLMVIHGYENYIPNSIVEDGAILLREWIGATQRHILGLFNVPEKRIFESAMELVRQHYVIINENGRYRRPYL